MLLLVVWLVTWLNIAFLAGSVVSRKVKGLRQHQEKKATSGDLSTW
jgi:hypothetical protein